jgi:diacylglycerol kinase family enzyme
MMMLSLVRNYIPSYQWVVKGGWNIADCVTRSYDVEGMHVGTVAAGRIGLAVLRRLKPFDMHLHYTDRHRLPESVEKELGLTFHKTTADMVPLCDAVTIKAPLHPETENLFDDKMIARMKRAAYLVNTARGKICNRDAVVRALAAPPISIWLNRGRRSARKRKEMVNAEVEYYRQRASAGSARHHQLTTYYQPPAFQRAAIVRTRSPAACRRRGAIR